MNQAGCKTLDIFLSLKILLTRKKRNTGTEQTEGGSISRQFFSCHILSAFVISRQTPHMNVIFGYVVTYPKPRWMCRKHFISVSCDKLKHQIRKDLPLMGIELATPRQDFLWQEMSCLVVHEVSAYVTIMPCYKSPTSLLFCL